jgi:hypothetical protein
VPKGDVRRKRFRAAKSGEAAPASASASAAVAAVSTAVLARTARPPMLGAVDAASVAALVAQQLAPQLGRSAHALSGPRARAAAAGSRVAGYSQESMRAYHDLRAVCDGLVARWAAGAAAQRAWHGRAACAAARASSARARLRADGDSEEEDDGARAALAVTPAWQVLSLCAEDAPAEEMLCAMRALLGAGQRLLEGERARGREQIRAGTPVPAPVLVSQAEFDDALCDGVAVAASATLLLAQLRVAASLHEYAAACELLLAEQTTYWGAIAAAMRARVTWSEELLAGGVALQEPPPPSLHFDRFFSPVLQKIGGAPAGAGASASAASQQVHLSEPTALPTDKP